MAKAKREASIEQNVKVIAQIQNAEIKQVDYQKDGNLTEVIEIRLRTPEGVLIKHRTSVKADNTKEKYIEMKDGLRDLVDRFKRKEDIYVQISNYRSQKEIADNKLQFSWFTANIDNNDNVWYDIKGYINKIESRVDGVGDDEVVSVTYKEYSNMITKEFKSIRNTYLVTMYVKDILGDRIILTNGEEDYPKELVIDVKDAISKATEGQAYTFNLKFIKGKFIEAEMEEEEDEANWDEDDDDSKAPVKSSFEPDRLIVVGKPAKVDFFLGDSGADDLIF